jgi:omega-6 fatty acid desaturase (delta-12 desaturase)
MLLSYAQPDLDRGTLQIATSLVPYLMLSVAMYAALRSSYLLTLALAVPAAGFLMRTYVLFHDCAHFSLLPSRRANLWLGRILGLVLHSPFERWRHDHVMHHATLGNLDRRGVGDVYTLTVAEYYERSSRGRLGYRLLRNPLVMFGLGPVYLLLVAPRLLPGSASTGIRRSVVATNIALVLLVGGLCWLIGWREYLLVWAPPALLAGAVGIWVFYVQHQFEGTYWERGHGWSHLDAALQGSSYLKLPRLLRFFTANIGLHHVHHLNARIPNYNLQRAHDENPVFNKATAISLRDALHAVRLKLWDEHERRLVTYAEARRGRARWARSATHTMRASGRPRPAPNDKPSMCLSQSRRVA